MKLSRSQSSERGNPAFMIEKKDEKDKIIAFAGNPNVGKSTLFNSLTGMNQHTGNWPGKTVSIAQGSFSSGDNSYILVDIPGTYSLMAHSAEEEVARNFICFSNPDAVVVVCDATCLERNLNLVLQTMEVSYNVIVCVNLMDEAKKKHIKIDLELLSKRLGVPVVGTVARKKKSLQELSKAIDSVSCGNVNPRRLTVRYPEALEKAISVVGEAIKPYIKDKMSCRWFSLRMLDGNEKLINEINTEAGIDFTARSDVKSAISEAILILGDAGIDKNRLDDIIVSALVINAESVCAGAVFFEDDGYCARDRKIDRILTSKKTGYPIMLLLLAFVFWLTVSGANYPSSLISGVLFNLQEKISELFNSLGASDFLHGILVDGVYRTLAWVVSVMLPPMAIFFPLFTLLEDSGYLPRIAYNLDKPFRKCGACGKQALTMCMGFGCNAAGVTGCRIIDSPRERLLAILTNNFVPCNGRFPTLIAIIGMFFITGTGIISSFSSTFLLTAVILLGVAATLTVTRILSKTVLRGLPSSFTLELPPYRKPQIGKTVIRSVFDRTLVVLGRAVVVAAPAGAVIWIMANISIGGATLLSHLSGFLDPIGRLMGLDGVILLAFILGFPANEIVMPIIIMAYTAMGSITEFESLSQMKALLTANGWSSATAICTMLFSLFHWPCSTTILTIKKETGSVKWTVLAAVIPTIVGVTVCILFSALIRQFA